MSKTIKKFIARADHGGCYFEVEAETFDEARELLKHDGFSGYLYEETYQLISTTPHIVGEVERSFVQYNY